MELLQYPQVTRVYAAAKSQVKGETTNSQDMTRGHDVNKLLEKKMRDLREREKKILEREADLDERERQLRRRIRAVERREKDVGIQENSAQPAGSGTAPGGSSDKCGAQSDNSTPSSVTKAKANAGNTIQSTYKTVESYTSPPSFTVHGRRATYVGLDSNKENIDPCTKLATPNFKDMKRKTSAKPRARGLNNISPATTATKTEPSISQRSKPSVRAYLASQQIYRDPAPSSRPNQKTSSYTRRVQPRALFK